MKTAFSLLLSVVAMSAGAQDYRKDWFPFVIPSLSDGTARSAIDLSFLSPKPAGADGFIRAKGETLVDGKGNPIRFFGTNICDWNVMPPKDIAPKIGKRLKELGVNFIRLHYYDFQTAQNGGIFNPDKITLNSEKLDQMDFLIHNLIENGVYVDLNLHVARNYPGLPEGWDWMGKGLDRIDSRLIQLQKDFARDILTHKNPYRGVEYRNEPGIAFVELNNENSMLGLTGSGKMAFAGLPDRYRVPIQQDWNAFLAKKYQNTELLKKAWEQGLDLGNGNVPVIISDYRRSNARRPDVEASGGGVSSLTVENDKLVWDIRQKGQFPWSHQLHFMSVPVENKQNYLFKIKAKSSEPLMLNISVLMQQGPWDTVGGGLSIPLTQTVSETEFGMTISNPTGVPVRLSLSSSNTVGKVEIDTITFVKGNKAPLGPDESLENSSVRLAKTERKQAAQDYFDFIYSKEHEYSSSMGSFLRNELKTKQLIWDTQVNYGGRSGILRETAHFDVIDIHSYPNHPSPSTDSKGAQIWSASPLSMVDQVTELERNPLWRIAGKPFFMTEYDLNPPNEYNNESYPLFTMLAAFQGWSGLGEYSWFNFAGYDNNRILSAFATVGNPAQIAWMPFSALTFRMGLIEPAKEKVTLGMPTELLKDDSTSGTSIFWNEIGIKDRDVWKYGTSITIDGKSSLVPKTSSSPFSFLPGNVMVVKNQNVNAVFGRTFEKSFKFDSLRVDFQGSTMKGYGNFAIVPLDGKPIASSKKMLITTVSRAENKGMKYNEARNNVGADWGEGPSLMEPVKLRITFVGKDPKITALNQDGSLGAEIKSGQLGSSAWYLVERP